MKSSNFLCLLLSMHYPQRTIMCLNDLSYNKSFVFPNNIFPIEDPLTVITEAAMTIKKSQTTNPRFQIIFKIQSSRLLFPTRRYRDTENITWEKGDSPFSEILYPIKETLKITLGRYHLDQSNLYLWQFANYQKTYLLVR